MPDHDSLTLAAAVLAAGGKPPRVLETLAEVFEAYHARDERGGPEPHVVLSPQLAKFFRNLEKKHGLAPAAARGVACEVVAEARRGEPGPIRVEWVNDWRPDPAEMRKEIPNE